jgi:hypothetical protein
MAIRPSGLISGLTGMVNQIKLNILKKFRAFYLKRVHETDLAPTKTFGYDFDISSSGSSHRRSLSKLKALIIKNIHKNNPVVALANKDFLPVEGTNNHVRINLFGIEVNSVMPPVNAKVFRARLRENGLDDRNIESVTFAQFKGYSRLSHSVIKSSVKYVQLERYLKYLEYLARKNGVPVSLTPEYELIELDSTDISMTYSVFVVVKFMIWSPATSDVEQWVARVATGASDAGLFSNPRLWTQSDFTFLPFEYKFQIAKFFLHLDKAVQVVNTLTRKIDYGYNAFSFRTA